MSESSSLLQEPDFEEKQGSLLSEALQALQAHTTDVFPFSYRIPGIASFSVPAVLRPHDRLSANPQPETSALEPESDHLVATRSQSAPVRSHCC